MGAGAAMAESEAEDPNGAPQGSPGPNSPAVDAAHFFSVWSAHGGRSTVVLNTSVVFVCTKLWCHFILPLVLLPTHNLTSMLDDGRSCASPYVRLVPCTLVFTNGYHLLQDEMSSLCYRYGQAMLKKIRNGSVNPGTNGSAADSPEHDCLLWLVPTGQLEGPNRDCTRPLRSFVNESVEKCVGKIDYSASGWSEKRREVRAALRKGLRTRYNRRRAPARLLAYRILGVYLDADVKEPTLKRLVLAGSLNDTAQAAVPAALGSASSIGYCLKLQDCGQEMERSLVLNGAAASIVGELLLLDPSEV